MQQFRLYQFNFIRYLLISVCIVFVFVFIFFRFAAWLDLDPSGVFASFFTIVMVLLGFAAGILTGIRVSAVRYDIETGSQGIKMYIQPPVFSGEKIFKEFFWEEIHQCQMKRFSNGEILDLEAGTPAQVFRFTNSILLRSRDMAPFCEAVNAHLQVKPLTTDEQRDAGNDVSEIS